MSQDYVGVEENDEGHQQEGSRVDQGKAPQKEGQQRVEEHKRLYDREEWIRFRLITIPALFPEVGQLMFPYLSLSAYHPLRDR